jgi:hypothetical protein
MGLSPKAEPPQAWAALAGVGAARLHDPLPLLRAQVAMEFPAELEAAAQVRPQPWRGHPGPGPILRSAIFILGPSGL